MNVHRSNSYPDSHDRGYHSDAHHRDAPRDAPRDAHRDVYTKALAYTPSTRSLPQVAAYSPPPSSIPPYLSPAPAAPPPSPAPPPPSTPHLRLRLSPPLSTHSVLATFRAVDPESLIRAYASPPLLNAVFHPSHSTRVSACADDSGGTPLFPGPLFPINPPSATGSGDHSVVWDMTARIPLVLPCAHCQRFHPAKHSVSPQDEFGVRVMWAGREAVGRVGRLGWIAQCRLGIGSERHGVFAGSVEGRRFLVLVQRIKVEEDEEEREGREEKKGGKGRRRTRSVEREGKGWRGKHKDDKPKEKEKEKPKRTITWGRKSKAAKEEESHEWDGVKAHGSEEWVDNVDRDHFRHINRSESHSSASDSLGPTRGRNLPKFATT